MSADPTDRVRETYVAAIQHDLVELSGDERLVGVVRRPTSWFSAAVDENAPALGPPPDLLDETKEREAALEAEMDDAEALHAAWRESDFEERYLDHLGRSKEAEAALDRLAECVESGETVVLVCYEGEDKPCHRHLLVDALAERVG